MSPCSYAVSRHHRTTTHQASWASLRKTVDCVLRSYSASFDAAAVLDFLSACVDVPKLWHGRAKHQPKHETQQVRKKELQSNPLNGSPDDGLIYVQSVFSRLSQGLEDEILESSLG